MESTSELGEKLDTLIRLQAAALVRDFGSQKDKIAFLAQAGGLGPKAIAEVLARPDARDSMQKQGIDPQASSIQAFTSLVRNEVAKWGKVIRQSEIKAE